MVGVVLATHGHLALSFLEVAEATLGKQKAVSAVGVRRGDGRKEISENLIQAISRVRQTDGILILTGMFGESNCRISRALFTNQCIRVVSGLNLPMLFKVLTHRSELNLNDLATCACESGRSGIIEAN